MSQTTLPETTIPDDEVRIEADLHPRHDPEPEHPFFDNEEPITSCEDAKKRVISADFEIQKIQHQKITEAIKKLDAILTNNPKDFRTLYQKGCALLVLKKFEEAKECLEQAKSLVSGPELSQNLVSLQSHISCVLAECYLKTGDRTRAQEMFSNLTESSPTDCRGFFGLGMCESAVGNFSRAIEQFQKAADLSPTDKDIPIKIARCYKCIGDRFLKERKFAEAIDYYTNAIKRNKHNVVFYCKRGTAYFLSVRKESAYMDFERATQLYKTKMPDVVLAKDNTEIEAIFIEDIITQHIRSGFSG